MKILSATKEIEIRFSEVDSMGIVWHGAYAKYFEDAREAFGKKYGIGYLDIKRNGYYAPLVNLDFSFKKPLTYGDKAIVEAIYEPCAAAKIKYKYNIFDLSQKIVIATGSSVQVFLNSDYQLEWNSPEFYLEWKQKYNLL
ncbi:MAG: acyl-CoA thioesterase [Bacteroidales bacterium]|jgi:acyl-CoA thioester hydrolase